MVIMPAWQSAFRDETSLHHWRSLLVGAEGTGRQKAERQTDKPPDRSRKRWKKPDRGREWRMFEWQREMDVKMGFWEIMNLHILMEKCMLSTKKKKRNCTTHLQNYRTCVTWLCVSLFVCVEVIEGNIWGGLYET